MARKYPQFVIRDVSRHGLERFYYRRGLGRRIRLPALNTPEFWAEYNKLTGRGEVAAVQPPKKWRRGEPRERVVMRIDAETLDYEKAKFPRRRNSSRVGLITFEQYLIEIVRSGRNRAKKKKVPFDIDVQYVLGMARWQDFRCALTNVRFFTQTETNSRIQPFVPSIDRIVPKLGYVRGNVRLVCFAANAMMLDWGEEVFRHVASEYLAFKNRTLPQGEEGNGNSLVEKQGVLRSRRLE